MYFSPYSTFIVSIFITVGDGASLTGGGTSDRDGTTTVGPRENKSAQRKTEHAHREGHEGKRKGGLS